MLRIVSGEENREAAKTDYEADLCDYAFIWFLLSLS